MSSLWKKFRGGSGEGTSTQTTSTTRRPSTSSHGPDSPGDHAQPPAPHLITRADEQIFMGDFEKERVDPLLVQSQFVKTVGDILNSPATLPYFLQFLQTWSADKYARFWIDANSFRAAAMTQSCNHKVPTQESRLSSLTGDNSYGSDSKEFNEDNTGSKVECVSTRQDVGLTRDTALILPDLVSNIQHASDVTPLNSPEGTSPSALTCITRGPSLDVGEAAIQSKDIDGSNCVSQWPKTQMKETESSTKQQYPQEIQAVNTEISLVSNQCSENISTAKTSTLMPLDIQTRLTAGDALRIYNKYLATDAEMLIPLDDEEIESLKAKIMVPENNVDPDCFVSLQKRIVDTLHEFLPKFLASDYFLKHQIDVLTSGCVRLADIIYSDSAFPYFTEYVEQEGGRGILQVWVAVSNFRQQLMEAEGSCDEMQAQADAMIIYDKYFSLQATCPQGFSDAVRFIVEGNICREGGPLPSCFDLPLRVVLHVLERDFLPGYLSSNLHIKYLGELINTVKTSIELLGRKKRSGSESTCSSEQSGSVGGSVSGASITTQNTLLAMNTRRLHDLTDPAMAMRIDESQLVDPDSLWRRKNYSRLSCGFINELGRFESEIQMHPEGRSESRLRKLRRFVLREEDKMREDLAYRMAEMVIRDVTNVTSSQDAPPPKL